MAIRTSGDWRDRAKCVGDNPSDYELDNRYNMTESDKGQRARDLCRGCKVIQECADEALKPTAVGTVRAGVWITGVVGSNWKKLLPAREQLKLISTGMITADEIHEHKRVQKIVQI